MRETPCAALEHPFRWDGPGSPKRGPGCDALRGVEGGLVPVVRVPGVAGPAVQDLAVGAQSVQHAAAWAGSWGAQG